MAKLKYDKDELWRKEDLSVPEAAYLLGGIPLQNVYRKLDNGVIEYVKGESDFTKRISKRIVTKSLFNYILKRRGQLYARADKFRLPSEENETNRD
jgi:hypothetical protein